MLNSKLRGKIKSIARKTKTLDLYRSLRKEYWHFRNVRAYKRISRGGVDYPSQLLFELTGRCNLSCGMCYQRNDNSARGLSLEEIDRVFHNLGPHVRLIFLSGGEIFLREDIFEILDLLKNKYGKECFLVTNGILVDENIANRLSRYPNIRGTMISLDGPRDVHNRLRGSEDAFDKSVNAIRLLRDKLTVSAGCVVTKENVQYLPELVSIVHGLGIGHINFLSEMFSTNSLVNATREMLDPDGCEIFIKEKPSADHDFSFELFQSKIDEARKTGDRLGVSIGITPKIPASCLGSYFHDTLFRQKKMACKNLLEGRIDYNGDVIFCHLLRIKFGNLLESSFEDIWGSEKMRTFRKKLLEGNLLPICRRCSCRIEVI